MSMTVDPSIKQNAELILRTCEPLVDFEFSYDEKSVAWLEGYIERLRARGAFEESFEKFASIFGCYLGEAIIRTYGGRWNEDEKYPLHVLFEGGVRVFPFAKVSKQMRNGLDAGDSILGFFRTIPQALKVEQMAS